MTDSEAPKKTQVWKIISVAFVALLAAALLFAGLLPSIVSSTWGKGYLTKTINEAIPGKVSLDHLSLSWFGAQKISGLKLMDPEGATVLELDSASIDSSLFKILLNQKNLNALKLTAFNANLVTDSSGRTNLMKALDKSCCTEISEESRPAVKAVIKHMNATISLPSENSSFKMQVDGQTEQNALKGQFNIDAELHGLDFLQIVNAKTSLTDLLKAHPEANLTVNAEVVNFPVELLDQIIALKTPQNAGLALKAIGNTLNLKVTQETVGDGITLQVYANSPTMSASADVEIGKTIRLSKPATVRLKVTPDAADHLFTLMRGEVAWKLTQETVANITIDELDLPLQTLTEPLDKLDPKAMELIASVALEEASFINAQRNSTVVVNSVHAGIAAKLNEDLADVSLDGNATNNEEPMKLKLNIKLPKELLWHDLSFLDLKKIVVEGQVLGAPFFVQGQDSLPLSALPELMGTIANISFSLRELDGVPVADINYSSERIELKSFQLAITDKIRLLQPSRASMKIPPQVVNQALKEMSLRFQSPMTLDVEVQSLDVPLEAVGPNLLQHIYKIDLNAKIALSPIKLIGVPVVDRANIEGLLIKIDAAQKTRPEIALSANIVSDGPGRLYDIIGKQASINASSSIGIGLDGNPTLTVFNVNALGDLCRAEISGRMVDDQRVILQSPMIISYMLTPAAFNSLGISGDHFRISQGAPIELTVNSSHIPLNIRNLNTLKLDGKIKLNDLTVHSMGQGTGLATSGLATLDHLVADWSIDGLTNRLDVKFSGITLLGSQAAAGKLNGSVTVDRWHENGALSFNESEARINVIASNLPTQFLNTFSNSYDFVSILGNALNIDMLANVSANSSSKGSVDIELSSQNLQGVIALKVDDAIRLNPSRQTEFRLDLTPDSYSALRQVIRGPQVFDFYLTDTAKATFKINALNLPLNGSMLQSGIDASYSIAGLAGQDTKTKNQLAIGSMQGKIISENLSKHVDFDMNAIGKASQGTPTSMTVLGSMDNGFQFDGSLNKDSLSLQLDATVETLPVSLLCQFVCVDQKLKNKFEAVIGPTLNANVKARLINMNGPLYVDLNGKNGHLNVDATINQGTLLLNRPATAQVAVTEQLSKYVLSEFIPVISGMLSADHPIKLTVEPNGFMLPLKDISTANVSIGQAALEMGKVSFSSSSQLAKVLSLLMTSSSEQFMVWLTPAYFSLNQGTLDLKRVDMLVSDKYPIAAWGNVDFLRERVNMIIGLSGSAIQKAFSVSKVPNSYFLQIPLRGKLDNPSFDKAKAAARLSALVAQTQGGPQGMVIGTVLDIASGGLSEPPPPPPTTNPLPWANMMADQNADTPESPVQKMENQVMEPIEKVKKGASSLLKKIFK